MSRLISIKKYKTHSEVVGPWRTRDGLMFRKDLLGLLARELGTRTGMGAGAGAGMGTGMGT